MRRSRRSVVQVALAAAVVGVGSGGRVGFGRAAAQEATPAAGSAADRPFVICAIPDQDVAVLNRQFGSMAEYLVEVTGLRVEYAPMVDYAALVTAFERGDVQLAWFGGLTGVQAQEAVPGAEAIAQRPRDAEFHSRFIVQAGLEVEELTDLAGLSFTFVSESSTSGHLMPRFFLTEAGIDPERDFRGVPNYSGSHDKTIALVEAGAFKAGAVSEAIWEARVEAGEVDTAKVRDFYTTPAYFDYHWGIRPDVDDLYGAGTTERVAAAILALDAADAAQKAILDLFQTESFIETENANYDTIRQVAKQLGILR